jgi:MFS family permease
MCMDISSEMIHSLLPVFLVTVLNASVTSVGVIEGFAEATALITRLFSGALSDRLGSRKALALAGYGIGTLTKPFFAMASSISMVFSARFLDRVGKGVRGAPRDALIADTTPAPLLGAAYGLRQSLDTAGAFMGPLLAMWVMLATGGDFRTVFWMAVVPGIAAVAILAAAVREPVRPVKRVSRTPLHWREIARLKAAYWWVVAFGVIFTMARFSEAFLLLRGEDIGVKNSTIPLIMVCMNLFYCLTSYPSGRLSDRLGRSAIMAAGLGILILADLVLAAAGTQWQVFLGASIWGLHMGLTQGLLSAMVADTAHRDLRGTAFGIFSMAMGLAILVASVLAGWLWDTFGAPATFSAGASLAGCALLAILPARRRLH